MSLKKLEIKQITIFDSLEGFVHCPLLENMNEISSIGLGTALS